MSALWQGAGLVRRLLVLVVLSAVSGVLVAGIALPVAAGVGVIAKSGTEKFEDLPTEFGDPTLATTTTFYANDGHTPIARFFDQDRSYVKLGKIAPVMRNAQLAIEDARFYEHGGADLRGMLRAAVNNAGGGGTQGASTLTQQYVKLSLVYQARAEGDKKAEDDATAETVDRKLRELRYAIAIEEKYSKDQILERYLNIAYYGAGAYGVQAAAQRYFRVSAEKLTLPQAALLAGLVQRPNATDPLNHPQAAEIRRNVALQRMADTPIGGLTQAQADAAKKVKVKTNVRVPKQECTTAQESFKWFCDYAKRAFLKDRNFGRTAQDRQDRLYRGGLRVMTTLDPVMQEAAQKGVLKWVDPTDKAAGVVTLVEPGTGYVKGIAISRPYGPDKKKGQSQVNLALNESLSGSIGTQAGSTFKAFMAAAALMKGRGFGYSIYAPGKLKKVTPVKTCDGTTSSPGYAPQNESLRENGVFNLRTALQQSINTYFIQLEEDIGVCDAATLAGEMGLKQANNGQDLQQIQSFTLGTNNVAPLDMAAAYATFAARGKFCPAYPFSAWYDRNNKKKPLTYKPECKQVLDTDVADAMNYLLRGVVTGGSGRRAGLPGIDVAGKTGTTNSRFQAWFMGYTSGLAGSATVWDPSPPKGGYTLSGKVIGGTRYGTVQGANLPAPMWHDTVGAAIEAGNVDNERFKRPAGRFFGGGQYSPSFSTGNGFKRYDPKDKKRDEPVPGDTNGDGKVDKPEAGAKPGASPSAKPSKPAKPGR